VEAALEGPGLPRQTASSVVAFQVSPQDQEGMRWYLEDYLLYPQNPAPTIAARIEQRMTEVGEELFRAIFHGSDDARDLWARLRERLPETRVEIVTGVREATALPWELLRDPKTQVSLALRARAFIRTQAQAVQIPRLPDPASGPVRILLVICRPGGAQDVPFRSVASRLLKGLDEAAREAFHLEVLRPPTFERLSAVLQRAWSKGQPYHVVHFDGHGAFVDLAEWFGQGQTETEEELLRRLAELVHAETSRFSPRAVYPHTPAKGSHGYLAFENPEAAGNLRLVDGQELGKLLAGTGTPVLVLNACRSAHAEPAPEPEQAATDPHTQVRAFGSLAQEVMDAGAAGVVAMRYNVYVSTAAGFVADLYGGLAQGRPLGEAVAQGRRQLAADPQRQVAFEPVPLQDWPVPVVYEAAPLTLFPQPTTPKLTITLGEGRATPDSGHLDPDLPASPDAGFYGRDETLLALDRALDRHRVVLLHAFAGSGKTAAAAEFARWYSFTGGVQGPVLFTSLERHLPLARVLDKLGQVFGPALEQAGLNWLALKEEKRKEVALQVLRQVPVLWVWDNVEPVAGFPAGAASAWTPAEQKELADFLRKARETKAKFLLTSRREERGWLGDLPVRVQVPPMPMTESVLLARALAEKHGRRLTEVEDWRPLLRFTQGNPLTITVLVGQALREGLTTKAQIEAFVERLRAGEAAFEDETGEGRARSLGASLSYGFEHAFSPAEQSILALLHLFQGFVQVGTLLSMGDLPQLQGRSREELTAVLDRAAEVGLLTSLGGGYYSIHPALPWFFRRRFGELDGASAAQARRAFVQAMGAWGDYYHREYHEGNRQAVQVLKVEEANLREARRLALKAIEGGSWDEAASREGLEAMMGAMQGLHILYDYTGRGAEWARLVQELVPLVVDPASDGPRPGREEHWSLVTDYRVRLARQERDWGEAERLQGLAVEWNRRQAAPMLDLPPDRLTAVGRNVIRTLAAALDDLGQIQRELGQPRCIGSYEEALALAERIGDQAGAVICAFNLGHAYCSLPDLRDLGQAENCYRRSLDLRLPGDGLGRGQCNYQLGQVAVMRLMGAMAAGKPETELLRRLNEALQYYRQSLTLLPKDAAVDLAGAHQGLGNTFSGAGDVDQARQHYQQAIRYFEEAGDYFGAGQTRYNLARALAQAGRLADARDYAQAARDNFAGYGAGAAEKTKMAQELLELIEQDLQNKGG
jgi:tetratricopeptide (TPR) repeat protein